MNVTPPPDGLLHRIVQSDLPSILVLGLHRGAGKRTVVEGLAREASSSTGPLGVCAAPRLVRDDDYAHELPTLVPLPGGTVVVTTAAITEEQGSAVQVLERTGIESSLGELQVAAVLEDSRVGLFGPSDPGAVAPTIELLRKHGARQQVLAAGREHRAFLQAGLFDGVVLSAGLGIAPSEERAVAAVGYEVDALDLERCDPEFRTSCEVARSRNELVVAEPGGRVIRTLPRDPVSAVRWLTGGEPPQRVTVMVPGKLTDELVRPMVQAGMSGAFVVQDVTCMHVAPIYFRAWNKAGGEFRVEHTTPLLAVSLNPHDPGSGESADPERFLSGVREVVRRHPVHDVVREASPAGSRWKWKFWSRNSG